jgi:hypothetical protein
MRRSQNAHNAKFTGIAHLPQSPGPEGLPRRRHNTSERYYRNLMYIELRTSDTLHKKPCGIGTGESKRKADPLVLEGDEVRIGLTMCGLYSRGRLVHILQKDCLCMLGSYFWA